MSNAACALGELIKDLKKRGIKSPLRQLIGEGRMVVTNQKLMLLTKAIPSSFVRAATSWTVQTCRGLACPQGQLFTRRAPVAKFCQMLVQWHSLLYVAHLLLVWKSC